MTTPSSEPATPRLRFAPSPNGYLHLGHALSALENERWAQALGGECLLRIEDTDLGRVREEYVDAIHKDLDWLGLRFDGPVRRQSDHLDDYQAALRRLWDEGLVYAAPASRTEIKQAITRLDAEAIDWPRDPDGAPHYPFGDRDRASQSAEFPQSTEQRADVPLRLDMKAAVARLGGTKLDAQTLSAPNQEPFTKDMDPSLWGDVLLRGRDRPVTYHLAVVMDDADQGITHVVRGLDMQPAIAIHRLLQTLLGLPAPLYHHHRLILGADGRKLSKSEGAKSLRALRKQGIDPATLRRRLLSSQT